MTFSTLEHSSFARTSRWLLVACLSASALWACAGEVTGDPPREEEPPPPPHWSFASISQPVPPAVSSPSWVRNGIDSFVLNRLEAMGIAPAPPASPEKLLRRVTLALTGLPPTLEELDAFLADPSQQAYEAAVDRLLASTAYAEHMTAGWLDLARYADTDGFQYDTIRQVWPWRDWVIQAFDSNMPFDQFTTHQLAGDLLPEPTEQSVLATGFNRNHPIQGENGLLLNEFRDRYVTDRVETLGKGWLGLTLGCAKCHDHKFDPITAVDFFRLYDCFNQVDEGDNGPVTEFFPTLTVPSPYHAQLEQELDARIAELAAEGAPQAQINSVTADRNALKNIPAARIMQDMNPRRDTHQLVLGRYDAPMGDPLYCSAPEFLPPFPQGAPNNRLGLAQWLLMPTNPLTARVTVNRFWHHHFGEGLVSSLDNFGTQVEEPFYLALLDWLAQQFIASGWDMKALHRMIVTSNTFQQSSITNEAMLEADLSNDLYARGPRFRLSAEIVRDMMLQFSGLLVNRVGGPPAFPYQPDGLWLELSWENSMIEYPRISGDGLYRRSVYSFWKRTLPPPFMSLFDAPDREQSAAYRELGTTPQQALALLNGPQFVEAARHLAARLLEMHAGDVDQAIAAGFRLVTSRTASETELATLRTLYENQVAAVDANPTATTVLQNTGDSATSAVSSADAAMTQVVRVLFNLSETITQE